MQQIPCNGEQSILRKSDIVPFDDAYVCSVITNKCLSIVFSLSLSLFALVCFTRLYFHFVNGVSLWRICSTNAAACWHVDRAYSRFINVRNSSVLNNIAVSVIWSFSLVRIKCDHHWFSWQATAAVTMTVAMVAATSASAFIPSKKS